MNFFGASLALVAASLAGTCGYLQQSPAVVWYRLSTSAKAAYAIYTLPRDQFEDYMKSYEIFEKETITSNEEDARSIVNYYQVINHLCALGEVEKMYIPPIMDNKKGIFDNQMIWEEKGMADVLDIKPNGTVLDVGCGRGRIAHHVASYTGAKVVGMNIDKTQLSYARSYAESNKMLGSKLDFVEGNYNKPLPFADETFDALYHVQALTYAVDLVQLFKEMNRVLKPGAKVSFLDWFALPAYNPEDPHHRKLLGPVKAVLGAVRTPYPEEYEAALKEAGFEVISAGEASVDGYQWPLIKSAEKFYLTSQAIIRKLTEWKLIPDHILKLMERLSFGGEQFIEADQKRLFTTSFQMIAQKKRSVMNA